jgi:hypothetical protein
MKFIQFYELHDENIENSKKIIFSKSYTKYTVGYNEDLNEEAFTTYFLDIKTNLRLSLLDKYKNKPTVVVTPRSGTLPSWSSICKNIFLKAGFPIEIVLKTRCFILRDDAGMENTPNYDNLYDRMTEEIFEVNENEDTEPIEYGIIDNMYEQPLYNIDGRLLNINQQDRKAYNRNLIQQLDKLNEEHGLSLSEEDKLFIREHGEDWEDFMLTIYDIAQSNSEHCRHHFFNGIMSFKYEEPKSYTLFDLVKEPYKNIQRLELKK